MSQKKIEQVLNDKGFRPLDILIYALLAVLIGSLFFALFYQRDSERLEGFQVLSRSEQIFTYRFATDEYQIFRQDEIEILQNDEKELIVMIHIESGGLNELTVEKQSRFVRMSDADCSHRKDCVHMRPLNNQNRTPVTCVPHSLTILPLGGQIDDGTIVG